MDKVSIERTTAGIVIILIIVLTFGGILLLGDQFFNWDIFTPFQEKLIGFLMVAMGLITIASLIVNFMINAGIIAEASRQLLHHLKHKK